MSKTLKYLVKVRLNPRIPNWPSHRLLWPGLLSNRLKYLVKVRLNLRIPNWLTFGFYGPGSHLIALKL
jgi:hypothetical protein